MAEANVAQIQKFADERMRPFCELARQLHLAAVDHTASIDDVYAALTGSHANWTDARTDGPPHLLVANDQLAWNSWMVAFKAFIASGPGAGDWPIILKACVRNVQG